MGVEILHVGFGNFLVASQVVAVVGPSSAPVKRMIRDAEQRGTLIDMTSGRKTKSVIVLNSGHVALSALLPETLAGRVSSNGPAGRRDTAPDSQDRPTER